MISKEEAVMKLVDMGYTAKVESGMVMIYVNPEAYGKSEKLGNVLRSIEYKASWGVRPILQNGDSK